MAVEMEHVCDEAEEVVIAGIEEHVEDDLRHLHVEYVLSKSFEAVDYHPRAEQAFQ